MSQPVDVRSLARRAGARFGRRGFTLIEMLVSLAVLALALSVVGVVFTITTKTVTQAAAYSEANNWIRQFTIQLKKDLDAVNPSGSVLTMVGRVQPAGLTQQDVDVGRYHRVLTGNPLNVPNGYDWELAASQTYENQQDTQYSDPRADILMFFSQRAVVSQAPPRDPPIGDPYSAGVKLSPIQVVYGHAALADGTVDPPGSAMMIDNVRHIEPQSAPAVSMSTIPASSWHLSRRATIIEHDLGRLSFYSGGVSGWGNETPYLVACYNADYSNRPGDVGHLDLRALWSEFGPGSTSTFSPYGPAVYSPYDFSAGGSGWSTLKSFVDGMMYLDGVEWPYHHVATVVEQVPVEGRSNLGVQMLPGCTWFQIEFLMPEDPRNSLEFPGYDPATVGTSRRSDVPRWTEVEPGLTYLFVPDTQENRDAVIDRAEDAVAGGGSFAGTRLYDFARGRSGFECSRQRVGCGPRAASPNVAVRNSRYRARLRSAGSAD